MKLPSETLSLPTLERPHLSSSDQSNEPEQHGNNRSSAVAVSQLGQQQRTKGRKRGAGTVFASSFLTIFLAEFGDKTQLSTLLMSAESLSPWVVFAGAAAALVTTSLLGVLLGQWLATRLEPKTVETAAGASLLLISVMLLWDVVQF